MSNDAWTPFHNIGHDIKVARDNGAITAALILTYAAMDAMAYLSMPENKKDVQGVDFINWVKKYMETDPKQPYQYNEIDLWGARCGIIHRYGVTSSLSDNGKCNLLAYHNGSEHIYNPSVDKRLYVLSWPRFINDFFGAMKKFVANIMKDEDLKKRVDKRIVDLFYVIPV